MDFYNVGLLSQYLKKTGIEGKSRVKVSLKKTGENREGHLERIWKRNWKY
jgi:hypothetical protein